MPKTSVTSSIRLKNIKVPADLELVWEKRINTLPLQNTPLRNELLCQLFRALLAMVFSPLMTSNFRVGMGVQNDPKKSGVIGYIIVGHGR